MPIIRTLAGLLAMTLGAGSAVPSLAQEDGRAYVMATAAEGGTYYPVGVAVAVLSQIQLEALHGISMEAIPSGGSLDNIRLMQAGEADFGILEVQTAVWARDGSGPLEGERPHDTLRAVTMLWPDVAHFLVRSDLATTGTVADLENLSGMGFSMGPAESGTDLTNRVLFGNIGFDYESWQPVSQTFDESVRALQDGTIAGVNIGSGVGASSVVHVMTEMADGVTLLSVTDEQAAALIGSLEAVTTAFIPAGAYPGVAETVQTIAFPNFLAVRADAPVDDVYQITRTLFENLSYLCDVHAAACVMTLESALPGLPVPLHPGAERYFQEAGLDTAGVGQAQE